MVYRGRTQEVRYSMRRSVHDCAIVVLLYRIGLITVVLAIAVQQLVLDNGCGRSTQSFLVGLATAYLMQ